MLGARASGFRAPGEGRGPRAAGRRGKWRPLGPRAYRDRGICPRTDDEMFSDIYKIREVADGLCLEVEGKVSRLGRGAGPGRLGFPPLPRPGLCNPRRCLLAEETLFPGSGFSRKVEAELSLEIGPPLRRPSSSQAVPDRLSPVWEPQVLRCLPYPYLAIQPDSPRKTSTGL